MRNKKIKFTATCEIENTGNQNLQDYLQEKLDDALECYKNELPSKCTISNIDVISVEEEKQEFIEGETCPICGYNDKFKIVDLTDKYVELFCPQCKSKFKIKICEE